MIAWRGSFICVPWLIHVWDMTHFHTCAVTHSCVRHDVFICVWSLVHMCVITPIGCLKLQDILRHVWHMTMNASCHTFYVMSDTWIFICVWSLVHMCDMMHSFASHAYVWHEPFMCVPWLIYMGDMTHSYVWHDSFIWSTHSYMCDMMHAFVCHEAFACATWCIDIGDMQSVCEILWWRTQNRAAQSHRLSYICSLLSAKEPYN